MKHLVTGAAGFIGFHVAQRLLARGEQVAGLDNLNDYYDVSLKQARLAQLRDQPGFTFAQFDLADRPATSAFFDQTRPRRVIHLAAQAGVRYSLANPQAYIDANLVGFGTVLEGCRQTGVEHLVYASSSSVYGTNTRLPFSVHDPVDHPLSLYAATKKANELMAHVYSHLFALPTTGLRFFTVYGPWGRPDMALFRFAEAIVKGQPIDVFNQGRMRRDFTYIDDVAEGVMAAAERLPAPGRAGNPAVSDPSTSQAPYRLYNLGNHNPVPLLYLVELLERELGRVARKRFLPLQPGDVPATWAAVDDWTRDFGSGPATPIEVGVQRFVAWYRRYFKVTRDTRSASVDTGRCPSLAVGR